jgi:hypothetical protein
LLVPHEPLARIIREALMGFTSGRFASLAEAGRFLGSHHCYLANQQGDVPVAALSKLAL